LQPHLTVEQQFDRGVAADLGLPGPPDPATALAWYRSAANAELPAAQLNAAVMYDSGRGTPRDPTQAAMWYGAAAAHGDARAAYDAGQLYAAGDGVPQNDAAARAWYEIAAARGVAAARHKYVRPTVVSGDALLPATPLRPSRLTLSPLGRDVALVWSSPPAPRAAQPVTQYVQLLTRNGTKQRMVYAGFVDATAALVTLPPGPADYAWRVLTVSRAGSHYVASDWATFSTQE
jgi:TPR repeat protein